MRCARCFAVAVVLTLVIGGFSSLNAQEEKRNEENHESKKFGKQIGDKITDFTLTDQNNRKQKLSEMLKKGPVAVVFHRSANW